MNLEKFRKQIDNIDHEIIKLLNERMELSLRTKKLKDAILDKAREERILDQLKKSVRAYNLIRGDFVENLYTSIIRESRKIQKTGKVLIGFQGEHGAFGEVAAKCFDPDLITIPCPEFIDVFEGVEKGNLDLGIVPVENSLGGAITQVNELLILYNLKAVGAVNLKISHCLLLPSGTNYREVRMVYSHSQALTQCRNFLSRHQLEARPYYDTAGAAKMLARDKPRMAGAIASFLCAELYNLEVIKENIQDHQNNSTRFLILSRKEAQGPGHKCSIIFSTSHRAGTLFSVLKIFAEEKINLTRIESLPHRDNPGNYVFFLDFQMDTAQTDIEKILEKVRHKAEILKYLGCYEEGDFG